MTKYSVLAIILAVIIGVAVGGGSVWVKKDKEKIKQEELFQKKQEKVQDSVENVIKKLEVQIFTLNHRIEQDSIKAQGLLFKIKQDGVKTEQKRKEIKQLTTSEQAKFIIDRYH